MQDPNDLNELIRQLTEGNQTSEDITRHIRILSDGRQVTDFTIIERTSLEGIPSTAKDFISSAPLPCGHIISKDNPFGGNCPRCHRDYCTKCEQVCFRCRLVTSTCCIKRYRKFLVCKRCRWLLRIRRLWWLAKRPFLDEEPKDAVEDMVIPEPKRPESNSTTDTA